MADTKPFADGHPAVDPERTRPTNPFDHDAGVSGQSYSRERDEQLRRDDPPGAVAAKPGPREEPSRGRDIPPENGSRAWIDPKTGEVHGSGAGAGGAPGEDYDSDRAGGADKERPNPDS